MGTIFTLVTIFGVSMPFAHAAHNLEPVPKNYSLVKSSPYADDCVIKTMPSTRSQKGLPICFASMAANLADEFQCYINGNTRCTEVSPANKLSQLDLSRLSRKIEDKDPNQVIEKMRDREQYPGLVLGGSVYMVLKNLYYTDMAISEECAPASNGNLGQNLSDEAQAAVWKKVKAFFESERKKCSSCGKISVREAEKIKEDYQLHVPLENIVEAMAQDTWEKAIDQLLIPEKCRDWLTLLNMGAKYDLPKFFPAKGKKGTAREMIAKAKELTCEKQRPVSLDFCAAPEKHYASFSQCNDKGDAHGVIIEGYREMCDPKTKKCIPSVKVRNSWGDEWQKANNDGWVDARPLFDAADQSAASMTWLEIRPTF